MMRNSLLMGLLIGGLALPAAAQSTGFRGDGSGRFPAARPPLEWSATRNLLWKTELPGGSPAAPVVVGERVFVVSDPALLLCLSASDGKILWQRSHVAKDLDSGGAAEGDGGQFNPDGDAGSAAATPVSDGKVVYAAFATGIVSAHRLDGTRLWIKFVEKPKTGYGHASSPALAGGKLLVQFVNLVALDAATGAERWRKSLPASHSSPLAFRIGNVDLVAHPSGAILRADDGKVLADNLYRLTQSSPIVHDGTLIAHENGRIVALELPTSAAGDALTVKTRWEREAPRSQYQIATPVVHGGYLYGVSMNGILHARDVARGEEAYRERLGFAGRAYVSPTLAGDRIFAADQNGSVAIVRPGAKFALERTNELDVHPAGFAFQGNRLFARTWRHLYCLGEAGGR